MDPSETGLDTSASSEDTTTVIEGGGDAPTTTKQAPGDVGGAKAEPKTPKATETKPARPRRPRASPSATRRRARSSPSCRRSPRPTCRRWSPRAVPRSRAGRPSAPTPAPRTSRSCAVAVRARGGVHRHDLPRGRQADRGRVLPRVRLRALGARLLVHQGPEDPRDKRKFAKNRLFVGNTVVTRHVPHGVVGIIGPWNYPFVNSIGDAIPALLAGNAVVLKPASKTPLTSLLIARGMREVGFPDDVFQVAIGPGAVGGAMVDNVDMIMFTGSTEVGKGVARQAVERLIPFSLELGGKDPLIVLDDADVQKAADHALYYSLVNGGQTCMSIERIYVDTTIYDEFVERLVAGLDKISFGDPVGGVGTVEVGSMTVGNQADIIEEQVADAVAKGAKVVRGGKKVEKADGAVYFEPTVLTEVQAGMEIVDEETFGPTIQIMRTANTEEAIRLANDNQYGLAAAVYGKDLRRAEGVARRVEAGTVSVNDSLVFWAELQLELGGWKQSGAGDGRHGEVGILKYTKTQGLFLSRTPLKKMPQMFPYGKSSKGVKLATKAYFRLPR